MIGDLFEVVTSKGFDAGNIDFTNKSDDTYEFIGRTKENYGLQGYVKYLGVEPNEENTISVSQIGSVHSQLRKNKWYSSQNIFILKPKNVKLFNLMTVACVDKTLSCYKGYSSYPTLKKLKEHYISLPVKNGNIDYDFMIDIISEFEGERISELKNYLKVIGLDSYVLSTEEANAIAKFSNMKFGKFKIEELFESENGDFDIQRKHINEKGDYVITAGITNNGILGKTDVEAKIFNKNTITVDMFGYSFYRDFKYKMVTHARVFSLIPRKVIDKKSMLFITTSLKYLSAIYGYGNMCSYRKIKNKKILLPIDSEGNIDYEYMNILISAIQKEVIKGVVDYADENIEATKKVVRKKD